MIQRRVIITPGYKAWEYSWGRFSLRIVRHAIGENDRFVLRVAVTLRGAP